MRRTTWLAVSCIGLGSLFAASCLNENALNMADGGLTDDGAAGDGKDGTGGSGGGTGGATGGTGGGKGGAGGNKGDAGTTADGPISCPAIACANAVACPYGNLKDSNGCDTCKCNPPPACAKDECGPPPPVVFIKCDDGSFPMLVCERQDTGKCGWATTPCPTKVDCSRIGDRDVCDKNDQCRWLEPGCVDPKLAATGCYQKADLECSVDRPCTDGKKCLTRNVDPCGGRPCAIAVCGVDITICL